MVSIFIFLMLNATDKLFTCLLVVYCACPRCSQWLLLQPVHLLSLRQGRSSTFLHPGLTFAPEAAIPSRSPDGSPSLESKSTRLSATLYSPTVTDFPKTVTATRVDSYALLEREVSISLPHEPEWDLVTALNKGRQHKLCSVTPERSQRSCSFRLAPSLSWISSLRNPATVL